MSAPQHRLESISPRGGWGSPQGPSWSVVMRLLRPKGGVLTRKGKLPCILCPRATAGKWQAKRGEEIQASPAAPVADATPSYPPSLLHWMELKKGWALSSWTPPPPAPRRRAGSNCSSSVSREAAGPLSHSGSCSWVWGWIPEGWLWDSAWEDTGRRPPGVCTLHWRPRLHLFALCYTSRAWP